MPMDLRDFLGEVARQYDRKTGIDSPAQQMLRSAPRYLAARTAAATRQNSSEDRHARRIPGSAAGPHRQIRT